MTDSHYYEWLYNIEDEVRQSVPILYYHVWDNYPVPHNNKYIYDSCDAIACISKVTHDIVSQVSTNKSNIEYIPHGVCSTQFTTLPKENTINCKKNILETGCDFLFFCNNKNLRRKQLSTTIQSYYEFCLKIGEERANKTCLLLHTNPIARNAPNLNEVADYFSDIGNILFSTEVVSSNTLCQMYNTADVTINIASNEGFGLTTLESLFCGTPIICTNTGGLSEQVNKDWGISLEPDVKNLIGSASVPLLFDDIVSSKSLCEAMLQMYNKSDKELTEMGKRGRSFAEENYSLKSMVSSFDAFIEKTLKSFEPRKRYKLINLNKQ
jgi:glycosyltransferase involved in cell wall biosynthesis